MEALSEIWEQASGDFYKIACVVILVELTNLCRNPSFFRTIVTTLADFSNPIYLSFLLESDAVEIS